MDNREKEEKLIAYQKMLKSRQIDETTYNSMVERNIGMDFAGSYKPRKRIMPLLVVVLLCLIVFGISWLLRNGNKTPNIEKEYEYINSYDAIDPPIQNDFTGSTTITLGGTVIKVDYEAYYEVSGRVVATASYYASTVENMAAQKDVAVVWGKLATDEYLNKFTFNAPGNRFVYWKTTDSDWYRAHTNDKEISQMHSNNHLVSNNKQINDEISNIKDGDYVRIKGYLVNLYWQENGSNHTWRSSLTRDDSGDGACEVIYVTDVKWLQEA